MRDKWSWIAVAVMVAGVALVAYALLAPTTTIRSGMGSGSETTRTVYEQLNVVLAVLGSAMAAGSGVFLLSRTATRPVLPPSAPPAVMPEAAPPPEIARDDSRLILRLLSGDEREVFRSLFDAGGEQPQRDIVERTKLSDAKVSRVLDRLEEKGLVVRERRGMGNMVRIAVDSAD